MVGSGYVYALTNPSMPGLVKIGCTQRDSRSRAREVFTTGVPTPFEVAFEVFSEDHEKLELQVHSQLEPFRVSQRREFFRYPLKDVIELLMRLNDDLSGSKPKLSAISILSDLIKKYPDWVDSEIADAQIVQTDERVWLEITKEHMCIRGDLVDQIIRRSDLAFIREDDYENWLSPDSPVTENARKFIAEFGPFSIVNTTDLFHEEACKEICERFNPHSSRFSDK